MRSSHRNWQPCRVCGKDHTNPSSSSICPVCGAAEAAARNADAYTDSDRFISPVTNALNDLAAIVGEDSADAVKALIEAMIEDERRG
jgi:hypothetical protein